MGRNRDTIETTDPESLAQTSAEQLWVDRVRTQSNAQIPRQSRPAGIQELPPSKQVQQLHWVCKRDCPHPPYDGDLVIRTAPNRRVTWLTFDEETAFFSAWSRLLALLRAMNPTGEPLETEYHLTLFACSNGNERRNPDPHLAATLETDTLSVTIAYYLSGHLEYTGTVGSSPGTSEREWSRTYPPADDERGDEIAATIAERTQEAKQAFTDKQAEQAAREQAQRDQQARRARAGRTCASATTPPVTHRSTTETPADHDANETPPSSSQQTVDTETRQNIDQATQPSTHVTDSTKTNAEAPESESAGDGEHHALDALFE